MTAPDVPADPVELPRTPQRPAALREPVVSHDDDTGLLVVHWPDPRPAFVEIDAATFGALVEMVNMERRINQRLEADLAGGRLGQLGRRRYGNRH